MSEEVVYQYQSLKDDINRNLDIKREVESSVGRDMMVDGRMTRITHAHTNINDAGRVPSGEWPTINLQGYIVEEPACLG